jgi:hypothetical protein
MLTALIARFAVLLADKQICYPSLIHPATLPPHSTVVIVYGGPVALLVTLLLTWMPLSIVPPAH